MSRVSQAAPQLAVQQWFNVDAPLQLADLRGRVVLLAAFQMLCPGCVAHGLPQATRVFETFAAADVVVIGLHTVFEHHAAMSPSALGAFIHEYRIRFPVAVDAPAPSGHLPQTMQAYAMQGTPSLVLIDRASRRRSQHFGRVEDLRLGAELMALIGERTPTDAGQGAATAATDCAAGLCAVRG